MFDFTGKHFGKGHTQQVDAVQAEKDELDRQIARLTEAVAQTGSVPELIRSLQEKSRLRDAIEARLAGIKELQRKALPADLVGEVRSRLKNIWKVLQDAEPLAVREELKRHIVKLTADETGLVKIEGTLSGALALTLVAGIHYPRQCGFRAPVWQYTFRLES